MNFRPVLSDRFQHQAARLPPDVYMQLNHKVEFLISNPRHPSLQTHTAEGRTGKFGGKIFEAYIDMQYRFTWEYGPKKGDIFLRNVDNHDECLKSP